MAKNRNFKKWIEQTIEYYRPYLQIGTQKIRVEKDDVNYMEITFTYPYLEPYIKYSEKAEKSWLEGHLPKDRILHELCHILTDPLYAKATSRYVSKNEIEDEREKLTDTLSVILDNLI